MSLHNLVKVTPDISCNRLLQMTNATSGRDWNHVRIESNTLFIDIISQE